MSVLDEEAEPFYPENVSPLRVELVAADERFAELREAVLLDYGLRTAAAYWGDLDSLRWWCLQEGVNVLRPAREDIKRYLDELRAAEYSPNTLARRLTTFRRFYDYLVEIGELETSPVEGLREKRRKARRTQG